MKKILIVEDDALTAHAYRASLERAGFAVEVVADGEAGLERLEAGFPDGVLLDLMMPKMGGIDLLKQVRAMPDGQRLPVVVYTNVFIPQVIAEANAAGATQVFDKSHLTPQVLAELFRKSIGPAP